MSRDLPPPQRGFTLIELVAVIVLIAILAVAAVPKFVNLSRDAKIAALNGVAGTMRSTIGLVKAKAVIAGYTVFTSNPGNSVQPVVDFGGFSSEVDWRNLCPESRAELGDQLTMIDFITLGESGGLTGTFNNRYTLVGYDIPGFSVPTNQGCYIIYDSFGDPDCTVTLVTVDC